MRNKPLPRRVRPAARVPAIGLLLISSFAPLQAGQDLSAELARKLHDYFVAGLALPEKDVMVEYASIVNSKVDVPAWDEARVFPGKRPPKTGLQMVKCGLYLRGKLQEEISVKARVRTFQDVVVCDDLIGRHQVVAANEVRLERLETTRLARKFFTALNSVVGMRTRKALRPGEVIKPSMIQPVPTITTGKRIKIHFSTGGVVLILPGVARQDGGLGDVIMVKCRENRKIYRGKVVNDNTVVVDF